LVEAEKNQKLRVQCLGAKNDQLSIEPGWISASYGLRKQSSVLVWSPNTARDYMTAIGLAYNSFEQRLEESSGRFSKRVNSLEHARPKP
jgi:hypothetical protein